MASGVINPFTDLAPVVAEPATTAQPVTWSMGYGDTALKIDKQGIWFGANQFDDAPFSVAMDGTINAAALVAGITMDDISNGVTYARPTFAQLVGADRAAGGLNSSYEIVKGFVNTQLNALSLPANGVRVDANGIYGRKASVTTFYIDTNGNAYFSGDIIGSTITGSTLQTGASGENVNITGVRLEVRSDDVVTGLLRGNFPLQSGSGYGSQLQVNALESLGSGDFNLQLARQLRIPSISGTPTASLDSGSIILDTTNSRIYFRVGTSWKYAALT